VTITIHQTLMLGSATASASCSLALGARASRLARGLAVAMVTVMATVTIVDAAVTRCAGALLLRQHADAMTEHHHHHAAIATGHDELLLLLHAATLSFAQPRFSWSAGVDRSFVDSVSAGAGQC
jgi:hypothetical protein